MSLHPYQALHQKPRLGTRALCVCNRLVDVNILGEFVEHDDLGGIPCLNGGERAPDDPNMLAMLGRMTREVNHP